MLWKGLARRKDTKSVRLTFKAPPKGAAEFQFEPLGASFVVRDGDFLTLEVPRTAVEDVEMVAWPSGVSVWVPYPRTYCVRDSKGHELDGV